MLSLLRWFYRLLIFWNLESKMLSFFGGKLRIVKIHGNVVIMSFSILIAREILCSCDILIYCICFFYDINALNYALVSKNTKNMWERGKRGEERNTQLRMLLTRVGSLFLLFLDFIYILENLTKKSDLIFFNFNLGLFLTIDIICI